MNGMEKTEVEGVSVRVKPLAVESDKHNVNIAKGSPAVTTLSAVSHPPHSQK